MTPRERKLASFFAVGILLCAACIVTTYEDEDDSDAIALETLIVVAAITFAVGLVTGCVIGSNDNESGNGDADRRAETEIVINSLSAGLDYYDNALAIYEDVWWNTNEHWIRQTEMVVASAWSQDRDYDSFSTLYDAAIYKNCGYMMTNACAQINEHYRSMSERLNLWNQTETYGGKISLNFLLDSTTMTAKTEWGANLGTVARSVQDGLDTVFLSPGMLYSDGACTITSASGHTINLSEGWNELTESKGFQSDVYSLASGNTYCGNMLPIIGKNACPLYSGMVITTDGNTKILSYNNGVLTDGAYQYDSLSIAISPEGSDTKTVEITSIFKSYTKLLSTIYTSMIKSNQSGQAIWQIYDKMGYASAYLTTLMVPDTYENINISTSQKSIITTLAMQQLAKDFDEHGANAMNAEYVLTDGSMMLFCRGDIMSGNDVLYEDVVYSPIFYKDTVLKEGTNDVDGVAFAVIWSEGQPLSTWNRSVGVQDGAIIQLATGCSVVANEIMYDDQIVRSVSLECSDIDIIDPNKIKNEIHDPEPVNKMVKYIEMMMILAGILMILFGGLSRNFILIGLGFVIIALSFVVPEPLAELLDRFGISDWTDP